jgi:hypothetical protein
MRTIHPQLAKSAKPLVWPVSEEPTIIIVCVDGFPIPGDIDPEAYMDRYSIHRETFVRNPETGECLRLEAWYDVSLWPSFRMLRKFEKAEYTLVFPPLPSHWQSFDLWEMKGTLPLYISGIRRNHDGIYIVYDKPKPQTE